MFGDAQGRHPCLSASGAICPHDATGPVNIFACSHICMSSANAMIQEHVPAFHKGWYNEFVDPNLDIRDGFLHAPQPGIGTRLKPEVRDRPDATVTVSDEQGQSTIDHWGQRRHAARRQRLKFNGCGKNASHSLYHEFMLNNLLYEKDI